MTMKSAIKSDLQQCYATGQAYTPLPVMDTVPCLFKGIISITSELNCNPKPNRISRNTTTGYIFAERKHLIPGKAYT